jgi:hypothetical protein
MPVIDRRDAGGARVDEPLQPGQPRAGPRLARGGGQAGQAPEVPALVGGQLQRAGQGVDHLLRGRDAPALLQPRVPGQADPGDLGDLLAAQAGRPAAAGMRVAGRARIGRAEPARCARPVSFMDNFATYNRPVLQDGELVVSLAVRPELPVALIAVTDIGAFAAIALGAPAEFLVRTVAIAGDAPTPPQVAEIFGRACGRPARFRQTPVEQVRRFDAELARMFAFFSEHPSPVPDLPALRAMHPGLTGLESWLGATGWTP